MYKNEYLKINPFILIFNLSGNRDCVSYIYLYSFDLSFFINYKLSCLARMKCPV